MSVRLFDTYILTWLWHDAAVHELRVGWAEDGEKLVALRCEIHPDEPEEELSALGIGTRLVEVQFRGVWAMRGNIWGTTADKEVVLEWEVLQHSELIEKIRSPGMAHNTQLSHHVIRYSGGSTIDIVLEECWLDGVG